MISNHLVSDDHLFAKSIKLQREQTKLTSHILIIHVTNTNEEINSHLSSPLIYKINSYYKYEKIPYPSTSIHEANFLAYVTEILALFFNSIALEENCRQFLFARESENFPHGSSLQHSLIKGRKI